MTAYDEFAGRCEQCGDTGTVCEEHPTRPWDDDLFACGCGGAGMPCPACCSPIPEDGTVSIAMAFVPDKFRPVDLIWRDA